ncbi:MAG: hypothetical protein FJW96_15270 [Actinobacteria bacterium]|nr:hypothetical protein [Actinomycetota bacterium]
MEEAARIIERLERIDAMRREAAGPRELLGELRCLLRDAEAWAAVEGGEGASQAVDRLRDALERPREVAPA